MPLTDEDLQVAIEENPESLFQLLAAHTPGAMFRRDAQMRRMCFGVPIPFFNGIAMARLNENHADAQIKAAIDEMQATGMPWSWQVTPATTPRDLAERLTDHGMQFGYDMPLMVADLDAWQPGPKPPRMIAQRVTDKRMYAEWCEVAQAAFNLPEFVFDVFKTAQTAIGFDEEAPVQNFLGIADDKPVCTGTVFFSHGLGGIYTIGTPSEHRGHGYGFAITEACMSATMARGFDTAFLQSSKMGFPLYHKIGFREVSKISIFVPTLP